MDVFARLGIEHDEEDPGARPRDGGRGSNGVVDPRGDEDRDGDPGLDDREAYGLSPSVAQSDYAALEEIDAPRADFRHKFHTPTEVQLAID